MPYSGTDDNRLPDKVKSMPADDQGQWVATFNKFYLDCKDEGNTDDACEQEAFAVAYAAVERMGGSVWMTIQDKFKDLMTYFTPTTERAITVDNLWMQIDKIAWEQDDPAFIQNVYFDEDRYYAVLIRGGKLFRAEITLTGTDVSLGEEQEVQIEFSEVNRSTVTIKRTADGDFRWFAISDVSVLNRVGEIDSTELFDSFIAHAEENDEYPIRQFYHAGEQFRTGQCDFLARDGNLLITSGLYDDSVLAKGEIKARQEEPDYWGDSVGFIPVGEPEMLKFDGDITIPVYRQGILKEISTVPEVYAASMMTAMPTLQTEVERMLNDKQFAVFLKLFDDDEDAAKSWLEENADTRNRAITDQKMVARDNQSAEDNVDNEPTEEDENLERNADVEGEEDETPSGDGDEDEEDLVFELDEAATQAIAERVSGSLTDTVSELLAPLQEALEEANGHIMTLTERIAALEETDVERHQTWSEDLSRGRLTITHRPTVNRDNQPDADEVEDTDEEDETPVDSAAVALDKISQL